MLCAMLITLAAGAATVKVTKGNKKILKEKGNMEVTFVWDNAMWGNGLTLKEQWKDEYDMRVADAERSIVNGFNKKNKKLKAYRPTDGEDDIQYYMEIRMEKVDYYFSVMSFVPGHKHSVWATVTVRDANKKVVCEIAIEQFTGDRDFVVYDSYLKTMEELGKKIANP